MIVCLCYLHNKICFSFKYLIICSFSTLLYTHLHIHAHIFISIFISFQISHKKNPPLLVVSNKKKRYKNIHSNEIKKNSFTKYLFLILIYDKKLLHEIDVNEARSQVCVDRNLNRTKKKHIKIQLPKMSSSFVWNAQTGGNLSKLNLKYKIAEVRLNEWC